MTPLQTQPRLSDFLLRLTDDEVLLAGQLRDPRSTMARAGLSEEQIDAVLAGSERLRTTLDAELAGDPLRRRLVVSPRMTVHTPTPDDDEPSPPQPSPQPEPERS